MPISTARVAPVGRNDLAVKPCWPRPAKSIERRNTSRTLSLVMARYGWSMDNSKGLLSLGRMSSVRLMDVLRQLTGSSLGSFPGGIFTSKPVLEVSFLMPKKVMVTDPLSKKWILSVDKSTLVSVTFMPWMLTFTPFGARSDGLVINTMASKVISFKRRYFKGSDELSLQDWNILVKGVRGMALDLVAGAVVPALTRLVTSLSMSLLCIGDGILRP